MRRRLALAIALVLGLPLLAPFFSFNSSLITPSCCRRNGQHQCMGGMLGPAASDHVPAIFAPKCPRFPMASLVPQSFGLIARHAANIGVDIFVRPAALPQTEARYRIAFARSRQKRGPPAFQF